MTQGIYFGSALLVGSSRLLRLTAISRPGAASFWTTIAGDGASEEPECVVLIGDDEMMDATTSSSENNEKHDKPQPLLPRVVAAARALVARVVRFFVVARAILDLLRLLVRLKLLARRAMRPVPPRDDEAAATRDWAEWTALELWAASDMCCFLHACPVGDAVLTAGSR